VKKIALEERFWTDGFPHTGSRSPHWLKSKNPASPAVRREAEEDWHWHR
jgi:hypothetical protein